MQRNQYFSYDSQVMSIYHQLINIMIPLIKAVNWYMGNLRWWRFLLSDAPHNRGTQVALWEALRTDIQECENADSRKNKLY